MSAFDVTKNFDATKFADRIALVVEAAAQVSGGWTLSKPLPIEVDDGKGGVSETKATPAHRGPSRGPTPSVQIIYMGSGGPK